MRACAVALALLAVANPAAAGSPFSRALDPSTLSPGITSGALFMQEGAAVPARGAFGVALRLDYVDGLLGLRRSGETVDELLPWRLAGTLATRYSPLDWLELAVALPFAAAQGDGLTALTQKRGVTLPGGALAASGLGDVRLLGRFALLREPDQWLSLAAIAEVRLPTGDDEAFLGETRPVFWPRLAAERTFGLWRFTAETGWLMRREARFLNLVINDQVTFAAGAERNLPPLGPIVQWLASAEIAGATPAAEPFAFDRADALKSPLEAAVGTRVYLPGNFAVALGVGTGLGAEPGYGRPSFRVFALVEYPRRLADRDVDGIPDDVDKCPDQAEDRDGFEDDDGCFEADNDADGIVDSEDACPDQPGPRELDGCPDADTDGIPDPQDACPDQPGPAPNDGCPVVGGTYVNVTAEQIELKANVQFETGKTTIQQQSLPLLDEVAQVLTQYPDLGPIRVEGHTDNVGSRPFNLDLSRRRAQSVVAYLVSRGIDKSRLVAAGLGFDRPIAPNTTALGRAKNRRVSFFVVRDDS